MNDSLEATMRTDRPVEETDGEGGEPGGPEAHWFRLKQLVEFAPDGYLVTDSQGLITEANQAAGGVLRCPKEFLIGKPLGLFVVGRDDRRRFYECLAWLNAGSRSDEFAVQVGRGGGGQLRDVSIRVTKLNEGTNGEASFRWLVRDVTERRQAEAVRQDLLRRLVSAQEDERRRVARELHDSLGQLVTAMLLGISAVRDAGSFPPAALERLDELQRLAHEMGRAVHALAVRLRPTALDDVGLQGALRQHLENWAARTGVAAEFQAVGRETARFPSDIETTLYRVVQEALTNVARHAHARRVSLVIQQQDGCGIVVVEDDGVGFDADAAAASQRLGLLGMRERLALVGGVLEIESSPGAGTTLIARIPLTSPSPEHRAFQGGDW
jgi:PAS domain S-box-containing protein